MFVVANLFILISKLTIDGINCKCVVLCTHYSNSTIYKLHLNIVISRNTIYTSCLKRTQETAQLAFPDRQVQPIGDFDERGFGQWEGLTANEIEAAFPEDWQAWLEAPFEVTPPEAEVFADFQTRVWAATESLLDSTDESIALVAHLGVLRLIYQHLVDGEAVFWNIDVPQGRVLLLEERDQTWQATLL